MEHELSIKSIYPEIQYHFTQLASPSQFKSKIKK